MRHQPRGHPRFPEPDPDAIAGDSRLGHLERGFADAIAIADTYPVVCQTVDGEVLPEVAGLQIVPCNTWAQYRYDSV